MDIRQDEERFDEYEVVLIRVKSKSAIGKTGLRQEDLEDIAQDIILDLLQRLPKYDPEKASRHTFIDRIVEHALADMFNERSAPKRDYRRAPASLDPTTEKIFPGGRDNNGERKAPWKSGASELTDYEIVELRHDIVRALEKLPPKLRDICIMLMQENICAVSAETGIPKATLIGHIKKIRNHFEFCGLENYF
ncbi:MAG TPA: sigma factor [bacterium]|mgnify:CR=1 FL=1|nr:sigma factor [bacterium]